MKLFESTVDSKIMVVGSDKLRLLREYLQKYAQ